MHLCLRVSLNGIWCVDPSPFGSIFCLLARVSIFEPKNPGGVPKNFLKERKVSSSRRVTCER